MVAKAQEDAKIAKEKADKEAKDKEAAKNAFNAAN